MDDSLISGEDIASKTFAARTKRGYEPAEVDAYLEAIGRQVDELRARLDERELAQTQGFAAAEQRSESEQESVELMLRIAKKTSEEVLTEARNRADEIVAEANFRAAQIGRESDRKAFEAASRTQAELQGVERSITSREGDLQRLDGLIAQRQDQVRAMANSLMRFADDLGEDDMLVDLTDAAVGVDID